MSIDQQIQEVEVNIDDAKKQVELGKAVERLRQNKDYQLVIGEGYLKDEALRNTYLLGDPNLPKDRYEDVQLSLRGIGEFNYFLSFLENRGIFMQEQLHDYEMTLTELHEEDAHRAE